MNDEYPFVLQIFTSGGKIYAYNKNVVNHYWVNDAERAKKRSTNVLNTNNISINIMLGLIQAKKFKSQRVTQILEKYKLSEERTLKDCERFSGVDFKQLKFREHAKHGIFEEWQEVEKTENLKNLFIEVGGVSNYAKDTIFAHIASSHNPQLQKKQNK